MAFTLHTCLNHIEQLIFLINYIHFSSRRYTCFEKTALLRKRLIHHEGILNIFGLHPNATLLLTQEMKVLQYKLTCNCFHCISLLEVVKSKGLVMEPVMKGVSLVFNFLAKYGYQFKSSSAIQNPDGSNSVHWVWIKSELCSDI